MGGEPGIIMLLEAEDLDGDARILSQAMMYNIGEQCYVKL
jgi:hypothetical protein